MLVGKEWLSFHGRLIVPTTPELPHDRNLKIYSQHLSIQVGLAPRTTDTHVYRLKNFFKWLSGRNKRLRNLALVDIEEYLSDCASWGWKAITIAGVAHVLKCFLRFSERRRWSPQRISWGVVSPRFPRSNTLRRGPSWTAVCALLDALGVSSRLQKRTKAMCVLLAKFGLRSIEVIELRMADVNFAQRTMTIRRAKNRRIQRLPMSPELINALRDYAKVRPICTCTHFFVTQTSPHRKVGNSSIYSPISKKIDELGIESITKGAHALRHAFAERLRSRGASTEEIGSFLGHQSSKFVGDYVCYSPENLREVAEFPIPELL
jgi:site-specific recombinase XerD